MLRLHKQIVYCMQYGVLRRIPVSLGVGPFFCMTFISVEHFLHTLPNGGEMAFQLGLVSFVAKYAFGVMQ